MSRDIIDIPEVFKRGMKEWQEGNDSSGDGSEGGNGRPGRPFRPWWLNRRVWLIGLILLLFLSFNWIVTTYTEWLWFEKLSYTQVWLKSWGAQTALFVLAFVIAAVVLLYNWLHARRRALHAPGVGLNLLALPGLRGIIGLFGLFLAFLFAQGASSQWTTVLRFFYRVPFGTADPVFNQDISFYLFTLPLLRAVYNWVVPLLFLTLLGVLGLYALNNLEMLQRGLWQPHRQASLRRQMAVLLTVLLLVWAVGYRLRMFELLYSSQGVVVGATYTDLRVRMPALTIQLALTLLLALTVAYNAFRLDLRPPLVAGAVLLVAVLFGGSLIPALVQRYVVEPNELERERPYITYNIDYTRMGFGLNETEPRPFEGVEPLTMQALADNQGALQNVRVWDYRPLQQTYAQLQGLRPYYQFSSIDVDRYTFDGSTRQVMLAAREINKAGLNDPSWVNERLAFTHGYGIVMNPVDKITPEGSPEFFIRDLPPRSTIPLEVTRPEIYYGELIDDQVLVNSGLAEFDYPQGEENVYSNYAGQGGVALSNALRRLAFAIRFRDSNMLLSQYVTPTTRIMFHRQIRDRVQRIAPFLTFDRDPYVVLADGRVVWMLDGYTYSNYFPYSRPTSSGITYIRNTVKVTIDAYDGTVTFYLADESDPLIRSYEAAFPDLFQPLSTMPASLQSHIRYPEDLFRIQTQQYLIYHMTDPQIFYNQEDRWEIPNEIFDAGQQPMEPYYVMFSLPGEEKTEYLLIQPYTPAGKSNMIAWIAARNDVPHYGELVVYELPKQELVFGPLQVEARIDQDPTISEQISLWDQLGSSVIRGNLIVVPIDNSFLYVEPLYLLSENSALPELKRVIVASGNRIAMRDNLEQALIALLEGQPAAITTPDTPITGNETGTGSPPTTPIDATVEELIISANAHFIAAETAQREGDWAAYGQELELLRQDLQRMQDLTSPQP
ncbi:MAG: UPF0182 family protein [Anaerolineales bacterium]|nr:UPF0182 family protein [Anaerolineales bacterium]MCB8952970.1 UPF0182 family protein [Ardenticatenales bacterium]